MDRDERLLAHALWLCRLRWVALAATTVAIALAGPVWRLLAPGAGGPMAACVACLAALNLLYGRRLRREARPLALLPVQIGVDLAALTLLLHFSGGIANPFHAIYVFHVVIAAIVLERRAAALVTATACVALTALAAAELEGHLPHVALAREAAGVARDPLYVALHVLAFNVVLVSSAWFTTLIVERGRAAEAALAEAAREATAEHERLLAVVSAADVGMRLLSKDDRTVVWHNRKVEQWFDAAGALGRRCAAAFGEPVFGCTTCLCESAASSRRSIQGERQAGGRRFLVTASPVLDERGEVEQVVELIRDVTQERETAAQLVQAAKLTAMGELAASVAHEVNNPTGIILGKAKLLLSDWREQPPDHVTAELEKVVRQAQRIADATQRLLDFARPAQGPYRESVDVNGVLDDCLALSEHRISQGGVRLETVHAPGLPRVSGDAKGLKLALLNVLNNAVDAMPQGGVLRVATGAEPDGRVAVDVSDTGSGIPPEALPRIFDPFFSTKGPRGTGLGLAITRRIVREHGGDVLVDSEVGKGSRFRLLLVPGRKS